MQTTRATPRVLLVDDHPLVLSTMRRSLQDEAQVWTAPSVDTALALGAEQAFDLWVSDLDLQDSAARDGIWLLNEARRRWSTPGIIVTGSGRQDPRFWVLRKPISPEALCAAVHACAKPRRGQSQPDQSQSDRPQSNNTAG